MEDRGSLLTVRLFRSTILDLPSSLCRLRHLKSPVATDIIPAKENFDGGQDTLR